MPIIEVTLLAGRTQEKKLALMRALTKAAIETLDAAPESVRVMIWEIPPENFAVNGVVKTPPAP